MPVLIKDANGAVVSLASPVITGSVSVYRNINLAATGQVVKGSAGQIYGGLLFNLALGTGVGPAAFQGATLNDLTSGGTYTDTINNPNALFEVEITTIGTPDQFHWRKNGGVWSANTSITGSAQTLSDGVTVTFAATTGHGLDSWKITTGNPQPRYLKIYDKATAPASSDTPLFTIPLPPPAPDGTRHFPVEIPGEVCGHAFALGIGVRATTGIADADTGIPGTNEVVVNILYF